MPSQSETSRPLEDVDLGAQIRDARLARLYAYWSECRGARRFPSRQDIDPLDFTYVLGNIMLLDVLRDPIRFRVRLHGSNVGRYVGFDLTGKMLDELPGPEYRAYVIDRCRNLVTDNRPLAIRRHRILDDRLSYYEALWLPLSDDGVEVNMLLCAHFYEDQHTHGARVVAMANATLDKVGERYGRNPT